MFADGLEEFDSSREIVHALAEEYRAAEGPNYINWGQGAFPVALSCGLGGGGWSHRRGGSTDGVTGTGRHPRYPMLQHGTW